MHLFRGHAGLGADVEKESLAAYIILSMHGGPAWRYMAKLVMMSFLSDNCLPRLSLLTRYGGI